MVSETALTNRNRYMKLENCTPKLGIHRTNGVEILYNVCLECRMYAAREPMFNIQSEESQARRTPKATQLSYSEYCEANGVGGK